MMLHVRGWPKRAWLRTNFGLAYDGAHTLRDFLCPPTSLY
jgi:hypothetical protein